MAFKLAIGNVIDFPVHLKVRDAGTVKDFKFSLVAKRIDSKEAQETMTAGTERGDQSVDDFLKTNLTNWRNQTLVLDEDGQPAAYSLEALAAVQSLPGASQTMYQAYLVAVLATDGAQGVRKN